MFVLLGFAQAYTDVLHTITNITQANGLSSEPRAQATGLVRVTGFDFLHGAAAPIPARTRNSGIPPLAHGFAPWSICLVLAPL